MMKEIAIVIIDTYDRRYYRDCPVPLAVRNVNLWAGLEAYGLTMKEKVNG